MDPIIDYFADLCSPDPSIRFSVLSRIEELTLTEEQLKTFQALLVSERDPGIRFHMQKVLARFGERQNNDSAAATLVDLLHKPARDEMTVALMLDSVKRREASAVVTALRQAAWPSFSAQLLPSVLKFLKKFGDAEDVPSVAGFCQHSDPRVLSAAVEALEKLCPDKLREHIVPLLLNENSGIRSRAVRVLYRFDPSEALRHFESMLFASSKAEKHAALFHSFFFPFRQIESLMLRFISVENDAELIKKAALVFMANPDRQIPMRLLEARQASAGEKQRLIDGILKGVLQSLFKAGIVNAEPAQMLKVLETHYREKRIRLFIERFSLALQSSDPETRLKSALKLCELVRHGVNEPVEIIHKYLATEPVADVKRQVSHFLESGNFVVATENSGQTTELPVAIADMTSEQRQRLIDSIDTENCEQRLPLLIEAFAVLSGAEKVAVLNAIERTGNSDFSDAVARCLDSDNPELLTAAIDTLSVINPEVLHPLLPQLIKHRFDEVKVAAIKVFSLFDKGQAISLVEKMLRSIKPVQRRNAIFCLAHFDFASVSQVLFDAIKNESDAENLQQIVSILKSNADEDTFFRAYIESRSGRSEQAQLYKSIYTELARLIVISDSGKTEAALYAAAEGRLEEERRGQSERASYQLEKIQKIRQTSEQKPLLDKELVRFALMAYSVGAVLTALIWFVFLAPPSSIKTGLKKQPLQQKSLTLTIKGTVSAIDKTHRLVGLSVSESAKNYRVIFPENYGKLPAPGDSFHGQVKVLSEKDGFVTAELLTAF